MLFLAGLLILVVLLVVIVGLGWLTGWLSKRYHWPALNVVFAVLALLPVAFFLSELLGEAATLAHQFPAQAQLLGVYQWETGALFGVAAALTVWACVRWPWLAFTPLPLACAGFYWLLLRPVYGHMALVNQYDLKGNTAFFILCAVSTLALLGLGAGYVQARLRAGDTE